ncbi:hypothetical protein JCM24511_07979 [Saitozyma sp. JCM 24511]|nr:hypothetical protein JCM24511_07979 [Saitozyma sp. JCM 24511]
MTKRAMLPTDSALSGDDTTDTASNAGDSTDSDSNAGDSAGTASNAGDPTVINPDAGETSLAGEESSSQGTCIDDLVPTFFWTAWTKPKGGFGSINVTEWQTHLTTDGTVKTINSSAAGSAVGARKIQELAEVMKAATDKDGYPHTTVGNTKYFFDHTSHFDRAFRELTADKPEHSTSKVCFLDPLTFGRTFPDHQPHA